MTNYNKKHLNETIKALNTLIEEGRRYVDTKTIRRINEISSSDHSRINFIWRSLKNLKEEGYLEVNGRKSPKLYIIKTEEKIDLEED